MTDNRNFKKFIIASVLLHLSLFSVLLFSTRFQSEEKLNTAVEILLIDTPANKDLDTPQKIVETDAESANEQLDSNAKYLSAKNNTVKKETKAKSGDKFQNSRQLAQKVQKQVTAAAKNNKHQPQLFDNGFNAYQALTKKEIRQAQQLAGGASASTTNDSLENVKDDLITKLNTREYRYYSYYTRIKTQLNQWWVPKVQQKFTQMMKQGRTIASEENKITKLIIVLNTDGKLVNVQVMAESGVRDLDDAAIEAFRSAAPFPNPPKGMIESDGTVKIRWDCVVES